MYYLDNIMIIFIIKGKILLNLKCDLHHGHVFPTSLSYFKGVGQCPIFTSFGARCTTETSKPSDPRS